MKTSDLFFTIIKLPLDFIMLILAGLATYLLRTDIISSFRPVLFEFNLPLDRYLYLVVIVSMLFLAAYALSGLYSPKFRASSAEEFFKIAIASSAGIMGVIIYIFLRQELFNSRFLVLGGWLLGILFVFAGRVILRLIQQVALKYDFGVQKIAVIGMGEGAQKIMEAINDIEMGIKVVKHLSEPNIEEIKQMISSGEINKVILASTHYPPNQIADLIDTCHEHYISFKYIPQLHSTFSTNFDIDIVKGYPLIELKRTALDGWGRVSKRFFDIIFALLALIVLSPVFLILAIAIKLDTKGPVFVRLERVSQNRKFLLYKFRSMIAVDPDGSADSLKPLLMEFNDRPEAGPLWKMRNDPRITRIGKLIRKTRIDELPQFWNVLKGDMSLVGPRPHQPDEIAQYEKHHRKLLAIKAGATGLAQISGSSDLPFEEEVALDSFYIDNWSLSLDFKIILKTAFKMLTDHSAV